MHTFEAAYARIEELSKQVEALTNEKYQLMVERDMARADATRLRKLGANKAARIDRDRRTIRALVVAGRGMYYAIVRALVGWGVPPSDKLTKQATMRIKYGIMRTREDGKE